MRGRTWLRGAGTTVVAVVWGGGEAAWGQATTELLTTQLPYAAYEPIRDGHYLMRMGRLGMNLRASVRVEYTDNASFSGQDKVGEWIMGPLLTAGFFLPVSEYQKLQLDVGIGYDYYSARESQFRLNLVPNSHLHYAFEVGDVRVTLANVSSTQADASSQVEIAGAGGSALDFNQLSNNSSLQLAYGASPRLTFSGGYGYRITRSLTDSFGELDRNVHSFNAGTTWQVNYPVAVGMQASYSMFEHVQRVQNDGQSWSVGPTFTWRPSDFWKIRGGVSMTKTTFDRTGTVADSSDFSAPTFDLGVEYIMNKRITHTVSAERSANAGFGANYTDQLSGFYSVQAQIGPKLFPVVRFGYTDAQASGPGGEASSQYLLGFGIGYPIARRLNSGLDYNYAMRRSEIPGRDYNSHRISLQLNYQF